MSGWLSVTESAIQAAAAAAGLAAGAHARWHQQRPSPGRQTAAMAAATAVNEKSKPHASGSGGSAGGSRARRDRLLDMQAASQAKWRAERAFEAEAGAEHSTNGQKFFGNFPYPYMNGLLHIGHMFTLSKVREQCVCHSRI